MVGYEQVRIFAKQRIDKLQYCGLTVSVRAGYYFQPFVLPLREVKRIVIQAI